MTILFEYDETIGECPSYRLWLHMLGYLELTLPTPEENLALDEALLLEAEAGRGGEVLRIWELPRFAVVLGSSGSVRQDVIVEACEADGVPILRRCSGGGTVLLGQGCLAFSLVLAYERAPALTDITHSYAYILDRIAKGLEVERAGCSDLAIGGMKISGNSQRRMRSHLLHHGTILYDFPISTLGRYLHQPKRQPDYRANRPHEGFATNLTMPRDIIVNELRRMWSADRLVSDWNKNPVADLVASKYTSRNWIWRR